MTTWVEIGKDMFCGCMSGWGQVVSMLPFENIKIKVVSRPLQYHGYIHAITKTIQEQGVLAFYKGMLMPLIGVGAQISVQFGFFDSFKKILKTKYARPDGSLETKYSMLSGFCAGIPSALVLTPLDHSRFRVTLSKHGQQGSVKTAIRILKERGITKLYLGLKPTMARECSALAVYFGSYDKLISILNKNGKKSISGILFSGGVAGLLTWTMTYPIDYVKTLIQTDSMDQPRFKSATQCLLKQLQRGSVKIFFKGFGIMAVRAFVVNACGFMCYEIGKTIVYDS